MNILHINKTDSAGGAAKIAWQLVNGQRKRGHRVDFFVADKKTDFDFVHEIKPAKWAVITSHLLGTDLDFFPSDEILKTKEYQQADVIHFHNIHGHYFNWKTFEKICSEKPVVWTLHDLWAITPYCCYAPNQKIDNGFYHCAYNSSNSKIKFFNQAYLRAQKRRAYEKLDFNVIAPSSYWLNNKLKSSVLSDKPSRVIYHGINTEAFKPKDKMASRLALGLPLDKKIILWVSTGGIKNIWKGWQDVQNIIESFNDNKDVVFLCLGGDNFKKDKGRIINRDYIKGEEEMSKYYSAADTLLLASQDESFALTVIEALCCNLPVVGYPVGIIPEVVVNGKTGYVANKFNWQDLAQGLRNILLAQDVININHYELRERFSLDRMVEEYINYYDYVLDKYE